MLALLVPTSAEELFFTNIELSNYINFVLVYVKFVEFKCVDGVYRGLIRGRF
jgi:hypothetical protein